uniref:Uncharacterized protein n=1 Tax=Arundo donax TaxID=35708 RepID=A0A0A9CQ61_ARUDO
MIFLQTISTFPFWFYEYPDCFDFLEHRRRKNL